jgi:hypothetical protein
MDKNITDLITLFLSIIGLFVSILAFIYSKRTSKKTLLMETSNNLMKIHCEIKTGRKVMSDIYELWLKTLKINLSPESLLEEGYEKEKESFCNFYLKNYHDHPIDSKNRILSDYVHTYFRQLHHLWDRIKREEFTKSEIAQRFRKDIIMDYALLKIYLEAHWIAHDEFKKKEEDRFWNNVPKMIDNIKQWK